MKNATVFRVTYTKEPAMADSLTLIRRTAEMTASMYAHLGAEIREEAGHMFEVGDRVAVELHRGAVEDDEGIAIGGGWIGPVVGIVDQASGESAFLRDPQTGRHLQTISIIAGDVGYPYRNARLAEV